MTRTSIREIWVGLAVVASLGALMGLMALAAGGPGFLTARRTVEVVFKDGQGIKVGSPVRVAGIESGRVMAVELAEVEGTLRARVSLAIPENLASRLKVDAKITIQAGLTGQTVVNVVSSGRSDVPLARGQLLQGVETSMFDPIMEQVGLGPVERSHLSHTVAQVRQTVDTVAPRLRSILDSLQQTTAGVRLMAENVRPKVEQTAEHIEGLSKKIEAAKIDETLAQANAMVAEVAAMIAENRSALSKTLGSVRDLTGTAQDILVTDRPKLESLLQGFMGTRVRLDELLGKATVVATAAEDTLVRNRPNIDRMSANGKTMTDYGVQLVQKLYGNPFYLSPLYKPKPDDIRAQAFYDVSITFMNGAKELNDALKNLEAMRSKAMSPSETRAYNELYQQALQLNQRLQPVASQLAEGMKTGGRR